MPDTDFFSAIERRLPNAHTYEAEHQLPKLQRICERRGVPYTLVADEEGECSFEWVGDPVVQEQVMAPARSALDDPRLEAARGDFENAREQLRADMPAARKHAVAEACNAVESGLKILLREHGRPIPERQNLDALIGACREADLFPPATDGGGVPVEQILAAPGRFGNRRGRHGSHVPHDVEPDEAEAVVASAAVALTLIAHRLPSA